MSGIYYTDLLNVLREAGCTVAENSTTAGWQSRARSTGGFDSAPLCVFWHHTASQTSPENDLNFMIDGSSDSPVGNMLIDRAGTCWPVAAGASNCAGKGGPMNFSRGQIPLDCGNTRGWNIEVANNGVGETWPQAQIDAWFMASNALNARFGNLPTDITSHALGSGNGYTSRKIDPATAAAVQGPWKPRSTNSSGTWNLDDMRSECSRRASQGTGTDDNMKIISPPQRIYDSRNTNEPMKKGEGRMIPLGQGAAITAAMVTIGATQPTGTGYLTLWAYGPPPPIASLNFAAEDDPDADSVLNSTIVPVAGGNIWVYASAQTHITLDLLATWS